jgi:hypothetical protein
LHQPVIEKCTVYPKPVNDFFVVNYSLSENAEIKTEILTLDGKKVVGSSSVNQPVGDNSYRMKLGEYNLADGMYICRVIAKGDNTHVYTTRILIEREK